MDSRYTYLFFFFQYFPSGALGKIVILQLSVENMVNSFVNFVFYSQ